MTDSDPTAAEMLRSLLDLVDRGELTADSEAAKRTVLRIQGAVAALAPDP